MPATSPTFDAAFVDKLDELFAWRRDVRHFLTDPLPDGMIEELLSLTQFAPSVGNAQPWRFIRVRTESLRSALAGHADAEIARTAENYNDERRAQYLALKLHGLREAPEILAIFSDPSPETGHRLGIATMPQALDYSTVMAIHTLWLAGRARGIGLGWVSIVQPGPVAALLNAPPSWSFIALLCLGYPAEPSATPELERRGWQGREDWRARIIER
jgi:5,6-dimethylbenzimidazole synthase